MKIKNFFTFILALFVINVYASELNLSPWIGKYPSTKIEGKTANNLLTTNKSFKKIIPIKEAKLIKTFTTEDVIIQEGDYILISKCKPHDCSSHHSLTIQKKSGELWIGIYENSGTVVSTRWYGATEYIELPQVIQKVFLRGHIPE